MKRIFLFALLLLSVSIVALGQEELPNDPLVNPDANACYEGGTLEGRCLAEIDWQAGWYLIRYEADMITYDQIPFWARYAANPEGLNCEWDHVNDWSAYVLNGFIPAGTQVFVGFGCGVAADMTDVESVYTMSAEYDLAYTQNGQNEATAICQSHGYKLAVPISTLFPGEYGNDSLYVCMNSI
jgi:hypothetical protein